MESRKEENIELENKQHNENDDFSIESTSDDIAPKTVSSTTNGGSKALPKMFMLIGVMFAIGAGLVFWKTTVGEHHGEEKVGLSNHEMELLLEDIPAIQKKQYIDNPEKKKELANSLKELFAISSEAQKKGYADDPLIKKEFEFTKKAMYATNYDKKINKDKGPMPPFGFISEDQIKAFWGADKDMSGLSWIWNGAEKRRNEAEFKNFLDTKVALGKKVGQFPKDKEPSEQEIEQAKGAFAKTMIYYKEAKNKLASLSTDEKEEWSKWKEKVELQIKFQKAQFLTQNYTRDVLTKKYEVNDADVAKYLAEHPELDVTKGKKKLADEVLQKVINGGDFAELAKEFSEDPGSKNKGGLYEGIRKGQFAKEFETAALALEPGEFTKELVTTNFGYHIIKLEKIAEEKGSNGKTEPNYNVRHILISTMVKDPDNPASREQPAEQLAKSKLAKSKQKQILDEITANNPVEIAEDFEVPEVSEEEIKQQQEAQMKLMRQRMQQQGGQRPKGAPPAPTKPVVKENAKPKPKK